MSTELRQIMSVTLFPELWQSPQPRRMIYRGQMILLNQEEYGDLLSKLPEFWNTENDKLLSFRYLEDNTYFCERMKRVYNYATKEWTDTTYVFDAGSQDQVDNLLEILVKYYQDYKLKEIQNINEQIIGNISDFSYLKYVILNSRERMLKNTDYLFISDYQHSDEQTKQKWIEFRQELRDITKQEAWINNDYANIQMPVSPAPMKQLPELVQEMQNYIPAHFKGFTDDAELNENVETIIKTMSQYMIKNQIIEGISKLNLPLFDLKVGTFDIVKSSENIDTFMTEFENFKNKIDSQLQEIGSSLTVEKIIDEMIAKTVEKDIDQTVYDIIDDLNRTAE